MYLKLSRKINNVIILLQEVQKETEEMYMSDEGPSLIVLKNSTVKDALTENAQKDGAPQKISKRKLTLAMAAKGFHSYRALALTAGLSTSTLYNSQIKTVTFRTLWKLGNVLDCRWEDIIED